MPTPEKINDESIQYKTIHTLPYSENRWTVKIDGEIDVLKIFHNKCEAIDYGRETAILNKSEHWIHNSDGTIYDRETYSSCLSHFSNVP